MELRLALVLLVLVQTATATSRVFCSREFAAAVVRACLKRSLDNEAAAVPWIHGNMRSASVLAVVTNTIRLRFDARSKAILLPISPVPTPGL